MFLSTMRGGAECAMSLNQPFQQVFVKSEPGSAQGSTTSLLSVHSPVLQKDSPKQFILRNRVEENIEQQFPNNGNVCNSSKINYYYTELIFCS